MNDLLEKYYGISVEYYKKYRDGIVFFVNGDYYYFFKVYLDNSKINDIYKLYLIMKERNIVVHDFILNNKNELLSEMYALIKLNYLITNIDLYDIQKFNVLVNNSINLKNDFREEWINRIDYLETQVMELSNCLLINNSFDYYIGVSEIILNFYNDQYDSSNDYYVVHSLFDSLSTIDFYNPLYFCLGNRYKDFVSYIKISNDWDILHKLLNQITENDKVYLFVRLSFPFEYFKVVNKMLIDGIDEKNILKFVREIDKYEEYLLKLEEYFGYKIFYWIKKDN